MSTPFSHFFAKINQISPLESNFTEVLEAIALKPKTLYFRGKMPENVSKTDSKIPEQTRTCRPRTVAIVGSRHNTKYGEEVTYELAHELGKHGVVVVSGLAFGIDSIGHRGCLDAGGTTVAVLGTPIDQIYPREHFSLAKDIIDKNGAIISEYPPRTATYHDSPLAPGEYINKNGKRTQNPRSSFLYRNRLISGLSDIVVVVEAAEKSGSLNTATHAIEQGKTVFAVPGNITNPYSQGCNKLIKQGAIPYTEPDDILRELFPEDYAKKHQRLRQQSLIGDTDAETLILVALSQGLRDGEQIMQATHLPPEVFNETITLLEIKSRVRSLGTNHWSLA
ncbi:DNA-protecting protein DprA [Candidatus Saccharibacteria bacterium]|nr:DNA-protecting protein DprA [Candidatus Saccharibacteria bacterium]